MANWKKILPPSQTSNLSTLNVPDEADSRNVQCTLNLISKFLFKATPTKNKMVLYWNKYDIIKDDIDGKC